MHEVTVYSLSLCNSSALFFLWKKWMNEFMSSKQKLGWWILMCIIVGIWFLLCIVNEATIFFACIFLTVSSAIRASVGITLSLGLVNQAAPTFIQMWFKPSQAIYELHKKGGGRFSPINTQCTKSSRPFWIFSVSFYQFPSPITYDSDKNPSIVKTKLILS